MKKKISKSKEKVIEESSLKKKKNKFKNFFFKNELSIIFPFTYIFLTIFSFFLTFLHSFFPKLVFCQEIFGNNVCTPIGVYITTVTSIPGYLVIGSLVRRLTFELPSGFTYIMVLGISILAYFLLGGLIDRLLRKKYSVQDKLRYIVITVFIVLLTLFIVLV